MANKFRFIDTKYGKAKRTHFQHTEDEIVLTLPDESGIVVTTNTIDDILDVDENGNRIAGYILKPDIGDNAGIKDENSNDQPIKRAPYVTSNTYVGPLEWTEWQACLDNTFNTLADSSSDPTDKDQWLPNIETPSTDVYMRYRFHSGDLQSPWSDTIHYVTPAYGIAPFTITVPIDIKPLIKTSGFRAFGQDLVGPINHIATTWKIKRVSDYRVIFFSEEDEINKTQIQIGNNVLDPVTEYIVEVTYHTDNEKVPVSPTRSASFVTPNVYIETPVLTFSGNNDTVGFVTNIVTGSPYVMVGNTEPHSFTKWELYAIYPDGSKKLVYTVDDMVNKTVFDISNIAYNSEVNYQVFCTYHSEHFQSETSSLIFKVVPFRTPTLVTTVVNSVEEFQSKLPALYNELGTTTVDGVAFKKANCSKWDKNKYVNVTEIIDTRYNGPIVFITSDDFIGSNKINNVERPKFEFERLIIRGIDEYKNNAAWYVSQTEESCVTEITKDNLRSFHIVEDGEIKRYYFFYPLALDTPYANKKHKMLENKLSLTLYFEHTKFNTKKVSANNILPKIYSAWKSSFLWKYNVLACDGNNSSIGSFSFIQNQNVVKSTLNNTDVLPKVFMGYNPTLTVEFYKDNALVTSETFNTINNISGFKLSATTVNKLKYNDSYKVVESIYVPKLGSLVSDVYDIAFKKATINVEDVNVIVTPETDEDMALKIYGLTYDYNAPSYKTTVVIPNHNGKHTEYNCDPKQAKYTIKKGSTVVFERVVTNVFTPATVGNTHRVLNVKDLNISTWIGDYNDPGDLVLSYNTNYVLSVELMAKNNIKSPVISTTFNTGNKPPVIIDTPTIATAQTINTLKVVANSSAFRVTGLSNRTHKATEWLVYDTSDLDTPIYRKTITETAKLKNFTFEETAYLNKVFWGKTYVYGVRYQAANNQWSDIGYSKPTTLYVPQAWRDIPVAGLGDIYAENNGYVYKVTSLRHPQMRYAKNFIVKLHARTSDVSLYNKYNGIYKSSMTYSGVTGHKTYQYEEEVVLPYKGTTPTGYTTAIACDHTCWILGYNADYWIEWYDGTTTLKTIDTLTSEAEAKTKYGFTQAEVNNMHSKFFPYATKDVTMLDKMNELDYKPTVGMTIDHNTETNRLDVQGKVINYPVLGTDPDGITGATWQLFKSNNLNTPIKSFTNDSSLSTKYFNAGITDEYVVAIKWVNTYYGYESLRSVSEPFTPCAVITCPYFEIEPDFTNKVFRIKNFDYLYSKYVSHYELRMFVRNNLNFSPKTYNTIINSNDYTQVMNKLNNGTSGCVYIRVGSGSVIAGGRTDYNGYPDNKHSSSTGSYYISILTNYSPKTYNADSTVTPRVGYAVYNSKDDPINGYIDYYGKNNAWYKPTVTDPNTVTFPFDFSYLWFSGMASDYYKGFTHAVIINPRFKSDITIKEPAAVHVYNPKWTNTNHDYTYVKDNYNVRQFCRAHNNTTHNGYFIRTIDVRISLNRNVAPTITATAHATDPTINFSMSHPDAQFIQTYYFTVKQGSTTVHTQNTSAKTGTKTNLQYATTYTVTGHVVFIDGTTSTTGSTTVTTCSNLYNVTLSNKNIDFALKGYDMHVYGYNVTAGTNIPLTGVNNNYWGMGVRVTLNKTAGSNSVSMKVTTYLRHWDGWPERMTSTITVNLTNTQTVEYGLNYQETSNPLTSFITSVNIDKINESGVGCISKYGAKYVKQVLTLLKRNGTTINQPVHTRFISSYTYTVDRDTGEIATADINRNYVVFCSYWRKKDYNRCYFRGYIGIKIDNAAGTITVGNVTNKIV